MPAIIAGAKPSGKAVPYVEEMNRRGIKKNKANEIARCEKGPQTFFLGNRRMVDIGYLDAWFMAQATGQIRVTAQDLKEARDAAVPNEKIREGKRRGKAAREAETAA
ncbi:hypothetical protein [Ruegeria lacuscaerulensis]|uniref:hypothetical protein n=1 Tax=Ruegeria lacuscaerulensis TaxID=55218 RepID=UPI00147E417E|nr:hypothetical protein [Ruegeria lacuscaerulensis]